MPSLVSSWPMNAPRAGCWSYRSAPRIMRDGMSVNRNQLQKGITMPVKRAAASKSSKTKEQDKPSNVRDETHETPEVETRKTTAAEAKQIDNDPGYSAEQLDQMAGYYGTGKQTVGEVVHITALGREEDDEES